MQQLSVLRAQFGAGKFMLAENKPSAKADKARVIYSPW
jgi:hypothetical protein